MSDRGSSRGRQAGGAARRARRIALVVGVALPFIAACGDSPAPLRGQDWRTISGSRQHGGEDALAVDVRYMVGRLRISPAEPGTLYGGELRYDARLFDPAMRYRSGKLEVTMEGRNLRRGRGASGGSLELRLGPDAALDLDLFFGAVEANVELGGLRVRRAHFATGASETRIRFSSPNPERASQIKVEVGAADFSLGGLGNANAERLTVDGGVGEITLDFTGEWRGDTEAEVKMGLGSLVLVLPRELGVRMTRGTVLSSFDPDRFVKRGDQYLTENWDSAERHLDIRIEAALSSIQVRWVD